MDDEFAAYEQHRFDDYQHQNRNNQYQNDDYYYEFENRPKIFSEKPKWKSDSKIKGVSRDNIRYQPKKSEVKIFNEKPKWKNEPQENRYRNKQKNNFPQMTLAEVEKYKRHSPTDIRESLRDTLFQRKRKELKRIAFSLVNDNNNNNNSTNNVNNVNEERYYRQSHNNHSNVAPSPVNDRLPDINTNYQENYNHTIFEDTEEPVTMQASPQKRRLSSPKQTQYLKLPAISNKSPIRHKTTPTYHNVNSVLMSGYSNYNNLSVLQNQTPVFNQYQNLNITPNTNNHSFNKYQMRVDSRRDQKSVELSNSFNDSCKPEVANFSLMGSRIKIGGETRVRPLANLNFQNSEERARVNFVRRSNHLDASILASSRSSKDDYLRNYLWIQK